MATQRPPASWKGQVLTFQRLSDALNLDSEFHKCPHCVSQTTMQVQIDAAKTVISSNINYDAAGK